MDDCANPLFLGWIKEWWDQAKERNTKGVLAYRQAYESLRVCPVRFEHPDQLLALRGFGPKTCARLLDRLERHCAINGLPVPPRRRLAPGDRGRIAATAAGPSVVLERAPGAARPRKRRPYVPALRQGGYAILMALSGPEARSREWMAKDEVVELAQPHCDASFTVRPPGKFYTAWESIKTLLQHDLVVERGRPGKRYALTEEGWEMASRLREVAADADGQGADEGAVSGRPDSAGLVPDGAAVASPDALPEVEPLELPAGSFSVRLVLDVRERVTGQRTYMEDELAKRGAKPLVRALSVGDAMWVAKCHDPGLLGRLGAEGDEVVLDWIVERKRQDDLVGSIRDGRFREQKFRLRRSGVPQVVYVIEESGMDADMLHRYEQAMQSAVAATQVVSGYFVKKTLSVDDTIAYLAKLTQRLAAQYAARPVRVLPTAALTAQNHLPWLRKLRAASAETADPTGRRPSYGVSYPAFASLTSKSETLTLRDVFLKMLMCTRGITGERALEIQKVWPTPQAFVQAFEEAGGDGAEDTRKRKRAMVSDVLGGLAGTKRRVTKPLSEKLAEVWAEG